MNVKGGCDSICLGAGGRPPKFRGRAPRNRGLRYHARITCWVEHEKEFIIPRSKGAGYFLFGLPLSLLGLASSYKAVTVKIIICNNKDWQKYILI